MWPSRINCLHKFINDCKIFLTIKTGILQSQICPHKHNIICDFMVLLIFSLGLVAWSKMVLMATQFLLLFNYKLSFYALSIKSFTIHKYSWDVAGRISHQSKYILLLSKLKWGSEILQIIRMIRNYQLLAKMRYKYLNIHSLTGSRYFKIKATLSISQ